MHGCDLRGVEIRDPAKANDVAEMEKEYEEHGPMGRRDVACLGAQTCDQG